MEESFVPAKSEQIKQIKQRRTKQYGNQAATMRIGTASFVSAVATALLMTRSRSSCRSSSSGVVQAFTAFPSRTRVTTSTLDPTFVPPDCIGAGITEELCIDTSQRMKRVKVPVSESIHMDGEVGISYTYWPKKIRTTKVPPVILIHGFDSSNLEFRRLGSRLASKGIDTYAVDLLGWGYTQLDNVLDFSASAKVEALQSFIQQVVLAGKDQQFCIAGASLGGAAAIETAVINPNCAGLILMDAQGFVDGVGMMSSLPVPLAKLGVNVLQSIPLRSSANQMSYYNKNRYATDEAVTVGRLHCLREGWNDALVNFMKSGGFAPSKFVPQVPVPSKVIWGRQDTILDGNEFAQKFIDTLPSASLVWIDECGHVPHLEQPDQTADAIVEFVLSVRDDKDKGSPVGVTNSRVQSVANGLGIAGISAIAASLSADWLPTF